MAWNWQSKCTALYRDVILLSVQRREKLKGVPNPIVFPDPPCLDNLFVSSLPSNSDGLVLDPQEASNIQSEIVAGPRSGCKEKGKEKLINDENQYLSGNDRGKNSMMFILSCVAMNKLKEYFSNLKKWQTWKFYFKYPHKLLSKCIWVSLNLSESRRFCYFRPIKIG